MQRDYVGYLLALVSVIVGVYVSWYYYEKSVQQRIPVFSIDDFPTTVYDSLREIRVPLKVTRQDGQPLTKSVHVATHSFWNSGNLPITASEVLTPIRISLTADLIAVSVVKQSRSVAECTVKQISERTFQIGFRILEQDDGCQLRIFYAGPQSPRFSISGEVVGVKKLSVSGETFYEYLKRTNAASKQYGRVIGIAPRALLWFAIGLLSYLYLKSTSFSRRHTLVIGAAIAALAVLIFGLDRLYASVRSYEAPLTINTDDWVRPTIVP